MPRFHRRVWTGPTHRVWTSDAALAIDLRRSLMTRWVCSSHPILCALSLKMAHQLSESARARPTKYFRNGERHMQRRQVQAWHVRIQDAPPLQAAW